MPYNKKQNKQHNEITNAVTSFIAKGMMPISTVKNDGFKQLIKVMEMQYQLPGRKYFSQTALPQLYTKCRETVDRFVVKSHM